MNARSHCPINLSVELLGDHWTLLVLRDVMFANRHTFGALLGESEEGIASNILSDRLKRLVAAGLLTRAPVEGHRQRIRYDLTERAVDLLPAMVALGAWSTRHLDPDPALAAWVQALDSGGIERLEAVKRDLRVANHLPPVGGSGA